MKKVLLTACISLAALAATAQEAEEIKGFKFTTVKENPITSIKNQSQSGTCWSYSGIAFFESELIRMGKGEHDLSETFVVHKTYQDRATKAIRLHGDVSFSEGGSFYDVIYACKYYGIIPQEAMPAMGNVYGDSLPNSREMISLTTAAVEALSKGKQKKLSPVWKTAISGLLDNYLGECPTEFEYQGKKYTPQTYAQSLGMNMDDYVSITSYTHVPFYEQMILEIPDNWRWALSYNLPIDEMMEVLDNAINKGFTAAWGSDVSEDGFTRVGVAVMPDMAQGATATGTDMARWIGMSGQEKKNQLTTRPAPELEITQEMRQTAYDNWETTDDHGMQIYGIAHDQNGKPYYMVKNSWGEYGDYKGILYASKAFVAYKTMNYVVHKDALPKHIAKKMGVK